MSTSFFERFRKTKAQKNRSKNYDESKVRRIGFSANESQEQYPDFDDLIFSHDYLLWRPENINSSETALEMPDP